MSNAAPLPPNAHMTNGIHQSPDHGEVNESSKSFPQTMDSLREVCADIHLRVEAFLNAKAENEITRRTQEQTRISLGVIEKALRDYDFKTISLSYNGGKDCLVLLILYLAVLHTHFTQPSGRRKDNKDHEDDSHFPSSIPSIYAKPPDPFPSVTSFVEASSTQYHLDLTHISTNPGPKPSLQRESHSSASLSQHEKNAIVTFRDAFARYLAAHPEIKAIFVGTRRTDPHGNHLTHFDPTDRNWPPFMRVHPVIDWRLSEIWCLLRSPYLGTKADVDDVDGDDALLAYCPMYDLGYTSLGGINDTLRNPRLKYVDSKGMEKYRPAYELAEDQEERLGRE